MSVDRINPGSSTLSFMRTDAGLTNWGNIGKSTTSTPIDKLSAKRTPLQINLPPSRKATVHAKEGFDVKKLDNIDIVLIIIIIIMVIYILYSMITEQRPPPPVSLPPPPPPMQSSSIPPMQSSSIPPPPVEMPTITPPEIPEEKLSGGEIDFVF